MSKMTLYVDDPSKGFGIQEKIILLLAETGLVSFSFSSSLLLLLVVVVVVVMVLLSSGIITIVIICPSGTG